MVGLRCAYALGPGGDGVPHVDSYDDRNPDDGVQRASTRVPRHCGMRVVAVFTAACGLRGGKTYWQGIRNELLMTIYDLGCNSTVGLRRS